MAAAAASWQTVSRHSGLEAATEAAVGAGSDGPSQAGLLVDDTFVRVLSCETALEKALKYRQCHNLIDIIDVSAINAAEYGQNSHCLSAEFNI